MIKDAMQHYFWLYNSITDMLQPYIEIYKKYHKDLKNEEILLTHSASQDNGCFDCSVHFVKKTEDFECD